MFKICPNKGFSFISYESLSIIISWRYSKSSSHDCLERAELLLVAKQQIQWKRQLLINHCIFPKLQFKLNRYTLTLTEANISKLVIS